MNLYEQMKAAALIGNNGGGGGGDVDNLLTTTIEVGTIDQNGANNDNANRLRTKDATTLSAGDYSIFFTSAKGLRVFGFRYAADGTFIERFGRGGTFQDPPLEFTATEGQKFRFIFNTPTGTEELQPTDLHNLILVVT